MKGRSHNVCAVGIFGNVVNNSNNNDIRFTVTFKTSEICAGLCEVTESLNQLRNSSKLH